MRADGEPLARKLAVPITVETTLTEEAYADDPKAAHERIRDRRAPGHTGRLQPGQGDSLPDRLVV